MRRFLAPIANALHAASSLMKRWPIWLAAALYFAPVSPHLRWEYSFREHGNHRVYVRCDYFGIRGFVRNVDHARPNCPVILMLDNNGAAR